MWQSLKVQLLEVGTVQFTGSGGRGSIIFSYEGHLVRLSIAEELQITIRHIGGGTVMLIYVCI